MPCIAHLESGGYIRITNFEATELMESLEEWWMAPDGIFYQVETNSGTEFVRAANIERIVEV